MEDTSSRLEAIASATKIILQAMGEDVGREGLLDTPNRVAKMYLEIASGLLTDPPAMTTFSRGNCDQMITVLDMDYHSLCEHHLVPFYGKVHIGYLPQDRISGLSKFGRVIDWYARRPQIQEQFTAQIADHIMKELDPHGVIVVVEGTHMCMSMRGVRKPNHVTVTSAIRGTIPKDEFFDILKTQQR